MFRFRPKSLKPLSQVDMVFEAFHKNLPKLLVLPSSPCYQLLDSVLCYCASRCRRSSGLGTPLRLSTMNVLSSIFIRFCPCTVCPSRSTHRSIFRRPNSPRTSAQECLHFLLILFFFRRAHHPCFFCKKFFLVCVDAFSISWPVHDKVSHVHQWRRSRNPSCPFLVVHLVIFLFLSSSPAHPNANLPQTHP